jgi:peptidoglycan/xylan/chitin deacetylase (PgdA/CDA1 family)
VLARFGISAKRFERLLNQYYVVTRNVGCVPTFPITAVILKRHPKMIRELYKQGVEFAVHGYVHIDYGVPTLGEQVKHFQKAIDTFEECQVPFTGFRAPFLRLNDKTPQAISKLGFPYDSSRAVHWGVIEATKFAGSAWGEYERLLDFYQSRQATKYLVLPRRTDGFIEIPVSMPDDEAMVERLGIIDRNEISRIWRTILERTYDIGELFTVQLHPERISYCEEALTDVIRQAKGLNPPVWVATLREIAEWWQERDKFAFEVHPRGDGKYRVKADCSERATVLLKNGKVNVPVDKWFDGYQSINARDFILESPVRPVIGVGRDSAPAAVSFLQSEGYIVEPGDQPDGYAIYLGNLAQFGEAGEKPLSQEIEQSAAPLLRYWRWPDRARSALSVTGDIDSITLMDFVLRIFENWRQQRMV